MKSPAEMMKTSASVMNKLASWDRHEECWEIGIPLPSKVNVKVEGGENWINVHEELHHILQENGVEYSTMGCKDGVIEVDGISLGD